MAGASIWTESAFASTNPEEQSRVRELKAGSEEAFDWLIAQYGPPVYRLAHRILHDPADAADAVQDVFLKVFRNIGQFHGESSLKTWIYRITVNTASNQMRWWRRHKERESPLEAPECWKRETLGDPADSSQNPFESLLSRENQEIVWKALGRLAEGSRTVLVLREMENLSYEEIGEILHLSLGTVKSRMARARCALKREVESIMGSAPVSLPVWNTAEE